MIWTEERYAECLSALRLAIHSKAGLDDDSLDFYRGRWRLHARESKTVVSNKTARAILERAAREWLEAQGAYVVPECACDGPTGLYVTRMYVPQSPPRPVVGGCFDSYAMAQVEAMLAILGDEK